MVSEGEVYLSPAIPEEVLAACQKTSKPKNALEELTLRQKTILKLIAEGRNNNAISEELKITKRAVEGYINAIYGKLDISDSGDVNRRVKAALLFLAAEPE